jgi:hypothetical protein
MKNHQGPMGRLKEKNREELLALIEQLLQRKPDLEPLLELLIELPSATTTISKEQVSSGKGRKLTFDPSTIERYVASAFNNASDDWRVAINIANELEQFYDTGKDMAAAGEWANAQVVYATIARETIPRYEQVNDEASISWVLGECAASLVECLEVQSSLPQEEQLDTSQREQLLLALFELWKFGQEYGGIEVDIAEAISEHVTEPERKNVEVLLRQKMEPGQDFSNQWHNKNIINFLATLKQADHFSDEDLLNEYRNAGLHKELAEKLLLLGRENEALDIAQTKLIESKDVIWFAEQLIQSGDTWQEQALAFIETRLSEAERASQEKRQDFTHKQTVDTYRCWLSEKYSIYNRPQQALNIAFIRFQTNLDTATYLSVRSATQLAGQPENAWPDLRPKLIHMLEQQNRWEALVTIYLDETDVTLALAALAELERTAKTSSLGYGYPSNGVPSKYQTQVAKAAEESYPNEAIHLYKSVIQQFIDKRGRENYQQAVGYLTQVRLLYQKEGREPEWQGYITGLQNNNKILKALKEELNKKGL